MVSFEMLMQLNSRGARYSTQPHWTLVRPLASLVNRPHVILNIIRSLETSTTLGTLKINRPSLDNGFTIQYLPGSSFV